MPRSSSFRGFFRSRRSTGEKSPSEDFAAKTSKLTAPTGEGDGVPLSDRRSLQTTREYPESKSGHESKTSTPLKRALTEGNDPIDSGASPIFELSTTTQVDQDEPRSSRTLIPAAQTPTPGTRFFAQVREYGLLKNPAAHPTRQDAEHNSKTIASNIFDSRDPLSNGIREYVDAKIAKVLHGTERRDGPSGDGSALLTAKIYLNPDTPITSSTALSGDVVVDAGIFEGAKRLGPFHLTASSLTYNLQWAIIALVALVVLVAAFSGPKTLFLMLWKMSVVLLGYRMLGKMLGWEDDMSEDVIMASVSYVAILVWSQICGAFDRRLKLRIEGDVADEASHQVEDAIARRLDDHQK